MRFIPLLLALVPSLVLAETLTGVASVVDGDTLEIRGEPIRLHGIDAPETPQHCYDPDGFPWHCGQKAASALTERINRQTVRCEGKKPGGQGQLVAICYHEGQDLNAWMVRQGWALAYRQKSRDYVSQERQAKASKAGIWSGSFTPPWEWRALRRWDTKEKDYPPFGHQGAAGRFMQLR